MKYAIVIFLALFTMSVSSQKLVKINGKYATIGGKLATYTASVNYTGFTYTAFIDSWNNKTPVLSFSTLTDSTITMRVNWGDGITTNYTDVVTTVSPTHTYASAGTYNVSVEFLKPGQYLEISGSGYDNINATKVRGLENLSSVGAVLLASNILNTDSLMVMKYPGSNLSGSIELAFSYNELPHFLPTLPLSTKTKSLDISNNVLSSAGVDSTINWMDTQTFDFAGTKNLYIKQSVPAPPTSASSAARANLVTKGWVLSTD